MQLSLEQDEKDDDDCLVMIDKQLETGRDPEIEFLGELQSTYSSNLLPESTPQSSSIRVPAIVQGEFGEYRRVSITVSVSCLSNT